MKYLIPFLAATSVCLAEGILPIEDLNKDGAVQALNVQFDDKISNTGGGIATDFCLDSPTFCINSSSNTVGIGTVSPTIKLSINGSEAIGSSALGGMLLVGSETGNHLEIDNTGIQSKSTVSDEFKLLLNPNGSFVGIRESAPATPLSVNGDTATDLSATSGFVVVGSTFGNHIAIDNTSIQAKNSQTASDDLFINHLGGSVSIGTTTVYSELFIVNSDTGPVSLNLRNTNTTSVAALTEFRVDNGVSAGNLFVVSNAFNDGSNFLPNEVGLVSESSAPGLHIRANGTQDYIRFTVGAVSEAARFNGSNLFGVGITSPTAMVHISTTAVAPDNLALQNGALVCKFQIATSGACPAGYTAIGTDDSVSLCMECD